MQRKDGPGEGENTGTEVDPGQPESQAPEGQPAGEQKPELVDVHEADHASVKAALKEAQRVEAEALAAESTGLEQQVEEEKPSGEPAAEKPEQKTAPQGASNAAKPQSQNAASNGALAQTGQAPSADAENERITKQRTNKELYIQRRGGELQTLRTTFEGKRTQLEGAKQQLMQGLEERAATDPLRAMEDREKIKKVDEQLSGLSQKEQRAEMLVEAESLFLRNVDTDQVSVDDMAELLKAKGLPDNAVAQFKQSPYEWTTPEALIEIAHHVTTHKAYAQADQDRTLLAKYVRHLEQENAQLKGKPRQVLAQVQKNLNRPRNVTPQSSVGVRTARDLDATRMTHAEVKAALKAAQQREAH